jgi:hypothetical protein
LSLRGDFGFEVLSNTGTVETLGALRWTECILHYEKAQDFGARNGILWFGYEMTPQKIVLKVQFSAGGSNH